MLVPLVVVLLAATARAAPAKASAPAQAPCVTCNGTGRADQVCRVCDGAKASICTRCSPRRAARNTLEQLEDLAIPEGTSPEIRAELKHINAKLAAGREQFEKLLDVMDSIGSTIGSPEVSGRLPCPARCSVGTACVGRSNECRYCDGEGYFPCYACESGRDECLECCGRGVGTCDRCDAKAQVEAAGRRCDGSGNVRCAGCWAGAYRYGDVTATLLSATGDCARADASLAVACARLEPYFDSRERMLAQETARRAELEKLCESERKRLADRRAAAQAQTR
jgi:hypothetical protein